MKHLVKKAYMWTLVQQFVKEVFEEFEPISSIPRNLRVQPKSAYYLPGERRDKLGVSRC